jgi:hypothetical protein
MHSHVLRTVGVTYWSEDEERRRFKLCEHHCVLVDLKAVDCAGTSCQSLPSFTRAATKRTFALEIFPSSLCGDETRSDCCVPEYPCMDFVHCHREPFGICLGRTDFVLLSLT